MLRRSSRAGLSRPAAAGIALLAAQGALLRWRVQPGACVLASARWRAVLAGFSTPSSAQQPTEKRNCQPAAPSTMRCCTRIEAHQTNSRHKPYYEHHPERRACKHHGLHKACAELSARNLRKVEWQCQAHRCKPRARHMDPPNGSPAHIQLSHTRPTLINAIVCRHLLLNGLICNDSLTS